MIGSLAGQKVLKCYKICKFLGFSCASPAIEISRHVSVFPSTYISSQQQYVYNTRTRVVDSGAAYIAVVVSCSCISHDRSSQHTSHISSAILFYNAQQLASLVENSDAFFVSFSSSFPGDDTLDELCHPISTLCSITRHYYPLLMLSNSYSCLRVERLFLSVSQTPLSVKRSVLFFKKPWHEPCWANQQTLALRALKTSQAVLYIQHIVVCARSKTMCRLKSWFSFFFP